MIPFHPYANLFPLITGKAFADLVEDVRANGVRERIVILDGQILDGRNRYRAALEAGLFDDEEDPRSGPYFASLAEGVDVLPWVLSKNLHRRHLDDSQRAQVAADLVTLRQGARTDLQTADMGPIGPMSKADAASALGVSERQVKRALVVKQHGAPELVEAVKRGGVNVSAASDIARLPVGEQLAILRGADPRAFGTVARERRHQQVLAKKERRDEREIELAAKQVALPDKRYGVILADPEWRFQTYNDVTGMDRAADNHYPTSPTEVIAVRPVGNIAATDCVLFLWATAPMLPEALAVMAAWGFTYKSNAVWAKPGRGTGYWFINQHEHLLVGVRGDVPAPALGTQYLSVFAAERAAHSEKPAIIHDVIDAYFPNLPKIELNARQARPGWDAWGLEAPIADEGRAGLEVVVAAAPFEPTEHDDALIRKAFQRKRPAGVTALELKISKVQLRRRAQQLGLGSSWR